MMRLHGLMIVAFAAALLLAATTVCAAELYLTKDLIYSLAALTEGERAGVLEEIKSANPDLPLADLTREGASVKLHNSLGEHMEILSNELYSLAVYVPQGIESDISRRSGTAFKVGRILKEDEGVRFYFGSPPKALNRDLASILTGRTRVKEVPLSLAGTAQPPVKSTSPSLKPAPREKIKAVAPAAEEGGARDYIEPVDLGKKPRSVSPAPRPPPEVSARFRERAARQPRVVPLSRRVTGVGVAPPEKKRKKKEPDSRELIVVSLAGEAPDLDGSDNDDAWADAKRAVFPIPETGLQVEAAAVTNGEQLYLLFSWPQSEPSWHHRPWTWSEDGRKYERGDLLDDGVAIRWQMESFSGNTRQEFDLWMWRAGREGAGNHVSDMKLLLDGKPFYMASGIRRKSGDIWARRDFDRGRLPFEIVLPSSFSGPEIASYAPCRPDGSASDVIGIGRWAEGRWVVEMSRALRTGNDDDIPFYRKGENAFTVSLLQGKDLNESPASEVLTLRW